MHPAAVYAIRMAALFTFQLGVNTAEGCAAALNEGRHPFAITFEDGDPERHLSVFTAEGRALVEARLALSL